MIQMKIFNGMTQEKNGKYYFLSAADIVNTFLKQENVEYVDCKYCNDSDIGDRILLIYRIKESE